MVFGEEGGGVLGAGSGGRSRVQRELSELKKKGLAKEQRGLFGKVSTPLTTPEEAAAFLAAQRAAAAKRDAVAVPPKGLSTAELDSWYMQQRQRDAELRKRQKEAEDLLRKHNYQYKAPVGSERGSSAWNDVNHGFTGVADARSPILGKDFATGRLDATVSAASFDAVDESIVLAAHVSDGAVGLPNVDDDDDKNKDVVSPDGEPKDVEETGDGEKVEEGRQETATAGEAEQSEDPLVEDNPAEDEVVTESLPAESPPDDTLQDEKKDGLDEEDLQAKEAVDEKRRNEQPVLIRGGWRDFVSREEGARFPPEAGRYHLFLSYACPWSHRTLLVLALKGLGEIVTFTAVHPIWQTTNDDTGTDGRRGWVFARPEGPPLRNSLGLGGPFPASFDGTAPDPLFAANSIRDVYQRAGDKEGKFTVPLLWDKQENTIVNNDSADIVRMLNSEFDEVLGSSDVDLYPASLRSTIDEMNSWLYPSLNHGVYRCGFATTQEAYEAAIDDVTAAFDRVEAILQAQRYMASNDQLTETDLRLFATLFRFDEVYAVHFKTNSRLVCLSPVLMNYCRDVYQTPGVAETCKMEHVKAHYFSSHVELNRYSVVPRGLDFMRLLSQPHNRKATLQEEK